MCFGNLDSRDYLRDQMDFKLNTKDFGAYTIHTGWKKTGMPRMWTDFANFNNLVKGLNPGVISKVG